MAQGSSGGACCREAYAAAARGCCHWPPPLRAAAAGGEGGGAGGSDGSWLTPSAALLLLLLLLLLVLLLLLLPTPLEVHVEVAPSEHVEHELHPLPPRRVGAGREGALQAGGGAVAAAGATASRSVSDVLCHYVTVSHTEASAEAGGAHDEGGEAAPNTTRCLPPRHVRLPAAHIPTCCCLW